MRILHLFTAVLFPLLVGSFALGEAPGKQPNILFIFSDDQAYEAAGFMGNDEVQTPHLDRLAESGAVFTHAYNQGSWSGAVCVASRAMLNTGRFLWHAHKLNPDKERQDGRFWSETMKQAGYDTYMTGKWHVQTDPGKAFDVAVDPRPGMPNQTKQGYQRPVPGKPDPWDPADPKFGGFWQGGTHWSEVVANNTIGFLDKAKQSDKPFFMYVAFNAPHDPRQAPQSYLDKYPHEKIAVPASYLDEYPFAKAIGCPPSLRDENLAPFPRTKHAVQVHRREYYAIIDHMDAQIGRILEALEASGQADNTVIIFTSDHGLAVGHHGLLGKQNMYDHSIRVPFIIAGRGIPQNRRIDAAIFLQDAMPTALELAGVAKPEHVAFHSILPLVRGEQKESNYDAIYNAYLDKQRAIIVGDYKLIVYPFVQQMRLYNLKDDPQEIEDLSDAPGGKAKVQELFVKLREWQVKTGDTLDLEDVFAEIADP